MFKSVCLPETLNTVWRVEMSTTEMFEAWLPYAIWFSVASITANELLVYYQGLDPNINLLFVITTANWTKIE